MAKKPRKKKSHRIFRMSKVRAYLLIKSIKKELREQERRIKAKRR